MSSQVQYDRCQDDSKVRKHKQSMRDSVQIQSDKERYMREKAKKGRDASSANRSERVHVSSFPTSPGGTGCSTCIDIVVLYAGAIYR